MYINHTKGCIFGEYACDPQTTDEGGEFWLSRRVIL